MTPTVERADRTRAADDGVTTELRASLLERAQQWFEHEDTPVLVLEGAPGTGKSVLATQVVDQLEGWGAVPGAVSLRGRDQHGSTSAQEVADRLVDLVQQRCGDGGLESAAGAMHVDIDVRDSDVSGDVIGMYVEAPTPLATLEAAVFPALHPSRPAAEGTVVCVLDALHEDTGPGSVHELVTHLPDRQPSGTRLRWVVTTTHAEALGLQEGHRTVVQLAEHTDDVSKFLDDALERLDIKSPNRQKGAVDFCDGNFLVAHYLVAEFALDHEFDPGAFTADADDKNSLGRWYTSYVTRLQRDAADQFDHVMRFLSLVAAAGPDGVGAAALGLAGLANDLCHRAAEKTAGYLVENDGRYSVYHPSFGEFLLSEGRGPSQQNRATAAHLATAHIAVEHNEVWENLGNASLGRLPWQLTRTAKVAADPVASAQAHSAARALAWQLFGPRGWVDAAEARLGWAALADPSTVALAHDLVEHPEERPDDLGVNVDVALARVLAAGGAVVGAHQHLAEALDGTGETDDGGDEARRYDDYLTHLGADGGDTMVDNLQQRERYARHLAGNGDETSLRTAAAFLARDATFNASSALCRAAVLEQLGDRAPAIEVLERFTNVNPEVAAGCAQLLREDDQLDAAEQALRQWVDEGVAAHEQVCFALVDLLDTLERAEEATAVLVASATQFANVAVAAAQRLVDAEHNEDAIKILGTWSERPATDGVTILLAKLYTAVGHPDEARERLKARAETSVNVALALVRHLTESAGPDDIDVRLEALDRLASWWDTNAQAADRAGRLLAEVRSASGDDAQVASRWDDVASRWDDVISALERHQETSPAARRQLAVLLERTDQKRSWELLASAAQDRDAKAALRVAYSYLQEGERDDAVAVLEGCRHDSRVVLRWQLLRFSDDPVAARKGLEGWMYSNPQGLANTLAYPIDDAYDPEPGLDVIAWLAVSVRNRQPWRRQIFDEVFNGRARRFETDTDYARADWCASTLGLDQCGQLMARVLWHCYPDQRHALTDDADGKRVPRALDRELIQGVCHAKGVPRLETNKAKQLRAAFTEEVTRLSGERAPDGVTPDRPAPRNTRRRRRGRPPRTT